MAFVLSFLQIIKKEKNVSQDTSSALHHSIEPPLNSKCTSSNFCLFESDVKSNARQLRSRLLALHKIPDLIRIYWLCQCLFGSSVNKQDETSFLTHAMQRRGNVIVHVICLTVRQSPFKEMFNEGLLIIDKFKAT